MQGFGAGRRGFGRGRAYGAGGRGWRHRFYATGVPGWTWGARSAVPAAEPEQSWLAAQVKALAEELAGVRARLAELQGRETERS